MPLRRLGVIGDIHAEHARLATAIGTLEARGVDRLIATGDVPDGIGSVDACCELLAAHDVVTVCGNHDRWLLSGTARTLPEATPIDAISERTRGFLESLPRMVELSTVAGLALLCHGIGPNDMAKVGPDDYGYALDSNDALQNLLRDGSYRWVVNGHSHRRMVRTFPGVTIINAGTLKRDQSPCFLEVDFAATKVLVFEFDADGATRSPALTVPLG